MRLALLTLLLAGCYAPPPDCFVETRALALDEETPFGFSPSEAAAALAIEASIPIEYADGSGATTLEIVSVPMVTGVEDASGVRPSYPRYDEWRTEDDELAGCRAPEVVLGEVTLRVRTADGLIDQEIVRVLTLFGPLEGSELIYAETFYEGETGGTWVGAPSAWGLSFEVRMRVERASDGALEARPVEVRVRENSSGPHGEGPPGTLLIDLVR